VQNFGLCWGASCSLQPSQQESTTPIGNLCSWIEVYVGCKVESHLKSGKFTKNFNIKKIEKNKTPFGSEQTGKLQS
jgi:hypothetical protein